MKCELCHIHNAKYWFLDLAVCYKCYEKLLKIRDKIEKEIHKKNE